LKQNNKAIEPYRMKQFSRESDGNNGAFQIPFESYLLRIIVSDGMGWDHVSVSLPNRCPNWKEMCFIKELFFEDEETVVQYHPKKSEYINNHPYCLHLWRKQDQEMFLPPSFMVGAKALNGVLVP